MKEELISLGFWLVFIGLLLIVLGSIRDFASGKTEVKGGGIIMIGPIPLVYSSDIKTAKILVILVIILMLVAALTMRWTR